MGSYELQSEDILAQDRHWLALNKPRGIPSQGRPGVSGEGLYESVLRAFPGERFWTVHFLDRVTSGVWLLAKTAEACRRITEQFAARQVRKTYVAWVIGRPPAVSGVIDLPLTREGGRPRVDLHSGKPAKTRYRVLRQTPEASLLFLRPATGRTHQLRVHLSAIGYPIWGDPIYGGGNEPCLLHALEIRLEHPGHGGRLKIRAPLRDQFFWEFQKP